MSKKDDLRAEAQSLGIDISDNPTVSSLQERIDKKMEDMSANIMGPDSLLGAVGSTFTGGRGDQTRG